jgi:inosose dehydratase
MGIALATGPVTWGVDFADAPGNPPWQLVLDEIAASRLGALELGPVGYLPEDPSALREALGSRGLKAVGSFVFEDLHDPARADEILGIARRACAAIRAAGGGVLVIIDRPGEIRAGTAGRSDEAERLSDVTWTAMVGLIDRVAEVAAEHGLEPVVHHHAGSYVEFEDEVDRLLADSSAGLCVDTGHAAYAGIRPEALIARYGARVRHVHLKDVDPARSDGLGFWDAIAAGVFCPLGAGVVDFGAVMRALDAAGYDGYATIEQDRVPGSGAPLEDLAASLAALAAQGVEVPA